jgi:hypothetical protein
MEQSSSLEASIPSSVQEIPFIFIEHEELVGIEGYRTLS